MIGTSLYMFQVFPEKISLPDYNRGMYFNALSTTTTFKCIWTTNSWYPTNVVLLLRSLSGPKVSPSGHSFAYEDSCKNCSCVNQTARPLASMFDESGAAEIRFSICIHLDKQYVIFATDLYEKFTLLFSEVPFFLWAALFDHIGRGRYQYTADTCKYRHWYMTYIRIMSIILLVGLILPERVSKWRYCRIIESCADMGD